MVTGRSSRTLQISNAALGFAWSNPSAGISDEPIASSPLAPASLSPADAAAIKCCLTHRIILECNTGSTATYGPNSLKRSNASSGMNEPPGSGGSIPAVGPRASIAGPQVAGAASP